MLTNAVSSSALGRMYAVPAAEDDRVLPVRRIEAVRPIDRSDAAATGAGRGRSVEGRDQRELALQQEALTGGVKAAFQSIGSSSSADGERLSADRSDDGDDLQQTRNEPDPLLDAAIMRFMHSVFRSLAAAEGSADEVDGEPASDRTGQSERGPGAPVEPANGRLRLAAQIDAFAARLARSDDAMNPFSTIGPLVGSSTTMPDLVDEDLPRSFLEAVQALRGARGFGPDSADGSVAAQPTRADLVQLIKRIAQAVAGAPPTVAGLPTSGSLLRERA